MCSVYEQRGAQNRGRERRREGEGGRGRERKGVKEGGREGESVGGREIHDQDMLVQFPLR